MNVERLVADLSIHDVHAVRLVELLKSPEGVASLSAALSKSAWNAYNAGHTITINPTKPTWGYVKEAWSNHKDVDEAFVRGQYEHKLSEWKAHYQRVGPKRSNNLVRRALAAMRLDGGRDEYDESAFHERFGCYCAEEVVRRAVRPWPEEGWSGVNVGSTTYGRLPKKRGDWQPLRRSDTPRDLYRLLWLFKPCGMNFDDMYKCGLFGVVSPCHRFAVRFELYKYELAGRMYVSKELATRTRAERGAFVITCGVPGADNGVATHDADAKRFFRMIFKSLHREWCVYGGNDFNV